MSTYRSALLAGAEAMGLAISDEVADGLAVHHALVEKWAKKINLTTVVEPTRAASVHGLDSLLFAELVEDDGGVTVDVGSGGGFPGIAVALMRPSLSLVLLEPIRKRASFLRTVLAELGLKQVRVVEGKLEAAPLPGRIAWPVDRIVSRATIPPVELATRAVKHLRPGGVLVLSGGAGAPWVEALAASGLVHEERRRYALPGGEGRVLDRLRAQ
ncbi:MAG: 16S rRNA (guanine(527)-N(7))-methyltransferase RsmG [Deltaproteobacteria bacterium]